ncbi:MAG: hypothetical protein ABSH00_13210 [Bryobacteraceae bacterium]|jgi:conjugal transfer/entry exclusion protein
MIAPNENQLRNTLTLLEKELQSVEAELARTQHLIQRRETLLHTINGIKLLLSQPGSPPGTGLTQTGIGNAGPIWSGAQKVLAESKQPMAAAEVARTLEALRWPMATKNRSQIVRNAMLRKPDIFQRVGGGKFRLKAIPEHGGGAA